MKSVIFGAGKYGKKALEKIGKENVEFFIDNDVSRQGTKYLNKEIISLNEYMLIKENYQVVVASTYAKDMITQLKELGINNYILYEPFDGYFSKEYLVYNPYENRKEVLKEEDIENADFNNQHQRKHVYETGEMYFEYSGLFQYIEIETINRCNGICSFCSINKNVDPRPKAVMTQEMFEDIIGQLKELNYSGRLAIFSNNEPLLDERIIEWNVYARNQLPNARIHLFTNGTLLTLDKFKALVQVLDELIINNYQQELKLIKPCQEIVKYCNQHPELIGKVTIVLRKPYEILNNRGGGAAPNRKIIKEYGKDRCVLPSKQMTVRPDGKISLCCNDTFGKYTLGDLSKERLIEIWNGDKFKTVRKALYKGRENWGECKYCDVFYV